MCCVCVADGLFPLDTWDVQRDHDFLDSDSIQSVIRSVFNLHCPSFFVPLFLSPPLFVPRFFSPLPVSGYVYMSVLSRFVRCLCLCSSVSLCVCIYVSHSVSVCFYLSLFLSVWLALSVSVCLSVSVSLCLSLSLSLTLARSLACSPSYNRTG